MTVQQPRLPPVLAQQPQPRSLASSLADEPIFDSPRGSVGVSTLATRAAHVEADDAGSVCGSEREEDLFAGDFEAASSSAQQPAQATFINIPSALPSSGAPSTPHPLQSAGPSGDYAAGFSGAIGRAAGGSHGGSMTNLADLQANLEHLSACGTGRGSRPIGIPRSGIAATYQPPAGAYMNGFVPPHQIVAASLHEADPLLTHSHRHKSTAERLRAAVFEQTGHMSVATGTAFLQTQGFKPKPAQRAA
ncbi:hypothetical protein HYH02_008269 [Chlamydomonas schloesseri]|uniref:Uncharacterized protein n=1 Tax=Chlamydomonas schloesseri TaxID=2026947 RepID=A0A835WGA4_9CHLO|nr:hypothetical protein HYH02_008269 [Chlamydomonas schloesseri]|eukprot:KAG2446704.1 hypothetical protein HYH02_008269 [Chlamydomonas schloesseri]